MNAENKERAEKNYSRLREQVLSLFPDSEYMDKILLAKIICLITTEAKTAAMETAKNDTLYIEYFENHSIAMSHYLDTFK